MKFRLIEADRQFYDYKTSDVVDDILFDVNKAEASYYNSILKDDVEYYRDYKNKEGKIVYLSPNEYYKICAEEIFHKDIEGLKDERAYNKENLEFLKDVILVQKKKFPIPIIDYTGPGQEGLHRMMVAGELVGWDTKQPVLVIDWADKERHERDVEEERKWRIKRRIDNAVGNALRYHYDNLGEFREQLQWDIDREFDKEDVEFSTEQTDEEYIITVQDVSYSLPIEKIKIEKREESDIDLDDIDIDDIDFSDEDWWKEIVNS
jgi:hypothetical protein